MDKLNFTDIIRESSDKIFTDYIRKKNSIWFHIYRSQCPRLMLIDKIWLNAIKSLETVTSLENGMLAEETVSALIKKGVGKDSVVFTNRYFQVKLANCSFRLYKDLQQDGTGWICKARLWEPVLMDGNIPLYYTSVPVKADPSEFADMLLDFDRNFGEIEKAADEFEEKYRNIELEAKKREIIESIQNKTIMSLVAKFLSPFGIVAEYELTEKDGKTIVKMTLSQTRRTKITIPFEDLAKTIADIRSLEESMTVVDIDSVEKTPLFLGSGMGGPVDFL